jgi:hypothetical protein
VTLIACLHPSQCRTLIADTLITSPKPPNDDFVFPTRIYIPQIREMQSKPVALRRKIVEINSNLVALWAGDYNEACCFAERAAEWFDGRVAEKDDLEEFLSAHYRLHAPNFHAIVAPADQGWLYMLGDVDRSFSRFAGDYAVAGSGKQLFRDMVDRAAPRSDSHPTADMDGLRIANDFMMREVETGEPIRAAFGAAYEVLYRGPTGFERVDDVLHCFVAARVYSDRIEITHHPHVTRQWYESDQLCIASLSTPEVHQQGMEFMAFAIPSITKPETGKSVRTLEGLAERPNYMCINHIFEIEGRKVPSVMTMRGDAIDRFFRMSWESNTLTFEYMPAYAESLHDQAMRARAELARQQVS